LSRFTQAWNRFWFAPGFAVDVATPRILLCGFLLFRSRGLDVSHVGTPFFDELWRPISFFSLLAGAVPSAELLDQLTNVWRLALAFGCIGLLTRPSMVLVFLLGLYVIGWGQNFGKVMHSHHVALLCTGILAFARCGDAWSVDALLRRRRGGDLPPETSSEYTWPVRAAWLVMTLMFFAAGVAKLRHAGLEWIFSDSFSRLLVLKHYEKQADLGSWGLRIAQIGWLCQTLAFVSVAIELGAPLALVSRRLRMLIVPSLLGMQIGIAALMGVHPRSPNFACYAFFVPWHALGARVSRALGRAGARADPATR